MKQEKIIEPEKWVDLQRFEGYYQISNHGRIKSLTHGRCVGTWYQCIVSSGGTYRECIIISKELKKHFGTSVRKCYKPINPKKSSSNHETIIWKNSQEFNEYLLSEWNKVSGETTPYSNYLTRFNMDIYQIVDRINGSIGCRTCCRVLNEVNLEIEWSYKNWFEISSGELSIRIIRFWLRKNGYITSGVNIKSGGLYEDESKIFSRVVYLIMGFDKYFESDTLIDEDELDIDGSEKLLHVGTYKMTTREIKKTNFLKSNKDESEDDFKSVSLDFNDFTSNESDNRLSQMIYNLLPQRWHDFSRSTSKKELNEMFQILVNKLYPEYSYSAILDEMSHYVTPEPFNFFKKLNSDFQKRIMTEIGKSTGYRVTI